YSPPMHPSHPIMVSLRQLQLTLREQNLMVVCLWNCLFAVFTSCLLTAEEADVGFSASCLTTAELQQHWRAVKQEFRSVKLLFDIPTTRIIDQKISKYVVYQVVVIRSGSYDCERVAIERRYSDFLHLHQELLLDFSEEMEDIVMPRKKMTGNFSEENIAERRVALRDYLTHLYSLRCVRKSQAFLAFFTHKELKPSYDLLRGGRFSRALEGLQKVLVLEEKLSSHNPTLVVPTLCAILVCQRDLEDSDAAFQTGRRALPMVRRYELRQYQGPLLEALVDLGYSLGLPVAQLQDELTRAQDSPNGQVSEMSLKELVVQEFV
uniref:Sorting nexin 20 n=1 Tax=Sinocyclocheilus rhinocerous TaxID=307959 RepID=A0A673G5C7_9TELE